MFDERSRHVGRMLFLLDMVLTVAVFVFSYRVRNVVIESSASFSAHLAIAPLFLMFLGLSLWMLGGYRNLRTATILDYGWVVLRALAISVATVLTLLFLMKVQYVSRPFLVLFTSLALVVLVANRMLLICWYFRRLAEGGEYALKVLVIGTGYRAERLCETLRHHFEWRIQIVGHLDVDPVRVGSVVHGAYVLGTTDQITSVLKAHVIDEVIIAVPRTMLNDAQRIADACEEEGVKLRLMADLFDLKVSRMNLVDLDGVPLLTLEPVAQDEVKLLVKRGFDLAMTLLALPLWLPVMVLAAAAIKWNSPGPVFFVQDRVGLRKRSFPMYKFRSMFDGSDLKQKDLEHLNEAQGPIFKIARDSRVTRVGRLLRQTSLDELPQLFNVIRGDMSLVGPRPMSFRDVDLFSEGIQRKRFSVKPGLTCLWQISGRSNLPFSKWVELDLAYIENWSLALDLKILVKTIPAVLKGSGAV